MGDEVLVGDPSYPCNRQFLSGFGANVRLVPTDAASRDEAILAVLRPDQRAAYEADRRPVTARLLEMTRQTGPERVMQLAYERAPDGFDDVHDVIPADELAEIATAYKRAAGFHPDVLNDRRSLTAQRAS